MNCAIILVALFIAKVTALSVDNQLVDARNDCFERIALEAMLPFEKTFRTEDTNSLTSCKDMCIRAGDNCQAISFGVHRRGNGTCQLSSEKIDSTGSRPPGTIFDPDFDLYARKTNCFNLQENTIPLTDPYDQTSTLDRGPSRPSAVAGSPILILDASPTPGSEPDRYALSSPTPTDVFSTNYPSSVVNTRFQSTRVPPPTYATDGATSEGWNSHGGDRIYFSHDVYPLYKYPMLYEQNYPAPNQEVYYPGGYAQNVPNVGDRYKPNYSMGDEQPHYDSPRPIFGLGYGNGYSYGKPVKLDSGPRPTPHDTHVFSQLPDSRPTSADSGYTRPMQGDGNRIPRPDYDHTTTSYTTRPGNGYSDGNSMISSVGGTMRPNDGLDFTNRPDPAYGSSQHTQSGGGYVIPGGPTRPPKKDGPRPGYDYVSHGQSGSGHKIQNGSGQGYNDDKKILTFFNPDDYSHGNRKMGQAEQNPANQGKTNAPDTSTSAIERFGESSPLLDDTDWW